ncbi:MerR family transcriptional regulator [Falsiroseomonas sp. HC035]|uniref:MerR family transcriptional regulator n=1 Tax=Falsiroseomonas sp. HC035 TaxID=3390999 RepID=UPI003D320CB8
MANAPAMTIGGLSRATGCKIETIRYYERIGVLPRAERRGRYRVFKAAHVERLAFVRRARALSFTLDEVRALVALASAPGGNCAESRALAAGHLTAVHARIADLQAMAAVLTEAVRLCDAGLDQSCPLIATLGTRVTAAAPT